MSIKAWVVDRRLSPPYWQPSRLLSTVCIVISVSICVYACLSASISPKLHAQVSLIVVSVARCPVWRRCDMLCTSSFTDDVMFTHKRHIRNAKGVYSKLLKRSSSRSRMWRHNVYSNWPTRGSTGAGGVWYLSTYVMDDESGESMEPVGQVARRTSSEL